MNKIIAHVSATLSFILSSVSWFISHQETILKWLTGLGAGLTTIFACTYYFFAIKEKIKNLKK